MAGFDLPLLPTATALGVGLLLGLVAERRKLDNPGMTAGLRTHTLAALAGAVTLWLGMPPCCWPWLRCPPWATCAPAARIPA